MNEFQKIIKALAICLAIFIIVSLINGFLYLGAVFTEDDTSVKKDFSKIYQNINSLYVDASLAKIIIKKGNEFSINAENVNKSFKVSEKDNTLKIKEDSSHIFFKKNKTSGTITITLPDELKILNIEAGLGKINIDEVSVNKFYLEQGAGLVSINNVSFNKTNINGGAGDININNSILNDLKLDAGVGKISVDGYINGKSEIDCGVGEINLNLKGDKDDYYLTVEKGIGSIKIDGINYNSNATYGNGENRIKVNGGIGAININFKDNKNSISE